MLVIRKCMRHGMRSGVTFLHLRPLEHDVDPPARRPGPVIRFGRMLPVKVSIFSDLGIDPLQKVVHRWRRLVQRPVTIIVVGPVTAELWHRRIRLPRPVVVRPWEDLFTPPLDACAGRHPLVGELAFPFATLAFRPANRKERVAVDHVLVALEVEHPELPVALEQLASKGVVAFARGTRVRPHATHL